MRIVGTCLLVACGGTDLTGVWDGSCTVDSKGESQYGLTYSLGQDGDALTGDAIVEAPFLTEPIGGTVTGIVDDDEVTLTAELGDVVLGFTIEHDLTLGEAGDTLDGECSVRVQSEDPFVGTGALTRTGDLPEEA